MFNETGPLLSSTSLPADQSAQLPDSVRYEDLTARIRRQSMLPAAGGGYGDIHKCFLDTGTESIEPAKVAVKSLRRFTTLDAEGSCAQSKMFCRELSIWARLHHENVLPFYGIAFGFGSLPAIVGPWAQNGTLGDYLACNPGLPTPVRVQLLYEIACGLHYLHSQMVIHGDLTGTNVLIDASGKACLSDFGLATIHHEFLGTSFFTSSSRGNVRWAAPELFQVPEGEGNRSVLCSKQTDVYAYGGIMLQVLSGKIPFFGLRTQQVYGQVCLGHRPPRENTWNGQRIPDVYWRFIEHCWDVVPSGRPSSFEVLEFMHGQLTQSE
ncbi:kinase-like domain-containing protein [Melanogaster broomeanus]|nr:kinase-like domain-containing protein [Melanogaster broomeanus]